MESFFLESVAIKQGWSDDGKLMNTYSVPTILWKGFSGFDVINFGVS